MSLRISISFSLKTLADISTMTSEPTLARGGILADDMGLGKTLQCVPLLGQLIQES